MNRNITIGGYTSLKEKLIEENQKLKELLKECLTNMEHIQDMYGCNSVLWPIIEKVREAIND